jgi:hypothetical protein
VLSSGESGGSGQPSVEPESGQLHRELCEGEPGLYNNCSRKFSGGAIAGIVVAIVAVAAAVGVVIFFF